MTAGGSVVILTRHNYPYGNTMNLKRTAILAILACFTMQVPTTLAQPAGNKATPVDRIKAAKGFKVELLYSVPADKHGSWVNLCTDNKGRLLVSDQLRPRVLERGFFVDVVGALHVLRQL